MNSISSFSLALYSSSRLLIQIFQEKLKSLDLTYTQFLTLSILWEEDGLFVNQIGERLELDSGTLTPLLKKLEAQNYVMRIRSEADERKVRIELTYPGKSLQTKTNALLSDLETELSFLEPDFVKSLNHSLQSLLEKLKSH
ncbi:MarR family winged helix-turn-helix transcriptional regulator [Algoriphagus hitonicola]|uniref:HTH-type transcriptional regulator SarZ n=1 Tax=Algoriphagus hitonicola TaxID=435880 RepID=A0A1I2SDM5_9BACT|nr:MarR family transcriptional regulator [Algoriphagus hitonicola]SFG48091.1 transcriptional regulator, MarR family [Algoriphagus hitonicola]